MLCPCAQIPQRGKAGERLKDKVSGVCIAPASAVLRLGELCDSEKCRRKNHE